MSTQVAAVTVRLLSFAQLRDRLGESERSLTLPAASTGQDLLRLLRERYPSAAPLLDVSRLAVNWEYAPAERVLRDGDEVAIIPPVSGG